MKINRLNYLSFAKDYGADMVKYLEELHKENDELRAALSLWEEYRELVSDDSHYYHLLKRQKEIEELWQTLLEKTHTISQKTLKGMDKSVKNLKQGRVSKPVKLLLDKKKKK